MSVLSGPKYLPARELAQKAHVVAQHPFLAHVRAQCGRRLALGSRSAAATGEEDPSQLKATTTIAAAAAHAAAVATMGERDALPPLPLSLGPPHLIPPAPTRDPRAIAFIPDLGGLPWVAYAAGSFLVISHLPSPSRNDSNDGAGDDGCSPFFRQVIDLRAPVSAAAWCCGGSGEVAAAAENSVSIFQPAPAASSPGALSSHLLKFSSHC